MGSRPCRIGCLGREAGCSHTFPCQHVRPVHPLGLNHYDMYFADGGNPTDAILKRFLEVAENEKGALAVHCKAGLGRTGTLISLYLMKHFGLTTPEVISWLRLCRPGSVIGPQQNFLQDMEKRMWREGEVARKKTQSGDELNSQMKSCAVGNGTTSSAAKVPPSPTKASKASSFGLGSGSRTPGQSTRTVPSSPLKAKATSFLKR